MTGQMNKARGESRRRWVPGGDTEVRLKGDVPASGHYALPAFQDSTRKYPAGEANTTSK